MGCAHLARGRYDAGGSFVEHGAETRPAAGDVGLGHAPEKTTLQRGAAVHHAVSLDPPSGFKIPIIAFRSQALYY